MLEYSIIWVDGEERVVIHVPHPHEPLPVEQATKALDLAQEIARLKRAPVDHEVAWHCLPYDAFAQLQEWCQQNGVPFAVLDEYAHAEEYLQANPCGEPDA